MTSKVDEESLLLEAPSTSKSFKSYFPKVAGAFVVSLCLRKVVSRKLFPWMNLVP